MSPGEVGAALLIRNEQRLKELVEILLKSNEIPLLVEILSCNTDGNGGKRLDLNTLKMWKKGKEKEKRENDKYDKLEELVRRDCLDGEQNNPKDLVRMLKPGPPEDIGNITDGELEKVRQRPFASRWYITPFFEKGWVSVWLRTHFTDIGSMTSPTRRIRDLVKATMVISTSDSNTEPQNNECLGIAQTIMGELLTTWFEMEPSAYYSLASMLASVPCDHGKGVTFELRPEKQSSLQDSESSTRKSPLDNEQDNRKPDHNMMTRSNSVYITYRLRKKEERSLYFTVLMNILFNKIAVEKFLVKRSNANIFRLAYCFEAEKCFIVNLFRLFGGAIIAFAIEVAFTGYLGFALSQREYSLNTGMFGLAVATVILSVSLSWKTVVSVTETIDFYRIRPWSWSFFLLAAMDIISNMLLPLILTAIGVAIILGEKDYIQAVINSTAVLFILEIDEIFPHVLRLDHTSIVRNFLILAALQELKELADVGEHGCNSQPMKTRLPKIDFADMLLTNFVESGSSIEHSLTLTPYGVKVKGTEVIELSNSNFITSDCLLSKIEWRYTQGKEKEHANSGSPRVGFVRVWKLKDKDKKRPYVLLNYEEDTHNNSDEAVVIEPHVCQGEEKFTDGQNPLYCVEGVHTMTVFEASQTMLRFRICGSKTAKDFKRALKTCSLWNFDVEANKLLNDNGAESWRKVPKEVMSGCCHRLSCKQASADEEAPN